MKLLNQLSTLAIQITGVETSSVEEVSQSIVNIFLVIRNFGLVVALIFGAFQVFKFIVADGREKMEHMKTIGLTLFGVVLLILLPSIINFIASFF